MYTSVYSSHSLRLYCFNISIYFFLVGLVVLDLGAKDGLRVGDFDGNLEGAFDFDSQFSDAALSSEERYDGTVSQGFGSTSSVINTFPPCLEYDLEIADS